MKIELIELYIENFKGIRALTLDLSGRNATIRGQNGTGKSTVQDSWDWIISGKDSANQANFSILTLDESGKPIDNQPAVVEATIKIDDKKLILKKEYQQKWTKKRGQTDKELTGHTTNHFIDGVPVSMTEYNKRISDIIDDNLFRILSDVRYFCCLKSEYRRNILLDLCGDISDNDILSANLELSELDSILSERQLVDQKKIVTSAKKQINRRIEEIPSLIKGMRMAITDVSKYDREALYSDVDRLDDDIKKNIERLGQLATGEVLSGLKKQKLDIEIALNRLDDKTKTANRIKTADLHDKKTDLEREKSKAQYEIDSHRDRLAVIEHNLIENQAMRNDLKKQFFSERSRQIEVAEICYACGQTLPEDKINSQIEDFNAHKAGKLASIDDKGRDLFSHFGKLEADKKSICEEIKTLEKRIAEIDRDIRKVETDIHNINNSNSVNYAKEHNSLTKQIDEITIKIEMINADIEPEKNALKSKIDALEDQKSVANSKLMEITHADKAEKGIKELEKELKQLAKEYQSLDKQLFLIEQFDRRKAEFIESNVSKHFKITQWKLFEEQINGGMKDICEPCVDGVPYSTNLNNGAKILVGLDCINAISKHYDISVPVFVDNAESLTNWIDFPHQTIRLVVDEDKKDLEVNYE